jgi:hypothetical protein
MIWVAWRQQRAVIVAWWAAVAALVAYMVVVGHASEIDRAASGCAGELCERIQAARASDTRQATMIVRFLHFLPLFAGVIFGAPLVAGELERGTNRLAWTQGISRARWFAVKTATAVVVALLPLVAVVAVVPWWGTAVAPRRPLFGTWFDVTGVVIIAYALFAICLGIFLGALLRRSVLTIILTAIAFVVVRTVIGAVWRPDYLAPLARRLPTFGWGNATAGRGLGVGIRFRHDGLYLLYQPFSRYWPFQWIETGIFVAMAAVLLAAAYWLVRRWRA